MKKWLGIFCLLSRLWAAEVQVPSGIDHHPFSVLLSRYVDEQGLVDYAAWKASPEDRQALTTYLESYAGADDFADGDEKIAGLINAYNAFTLQTILEVYPVESIRLIDDPFGAKRHLIGGRKVSLDEIEHDSLRPLIGWQVHALVVCAARSCPPLAAEAFLPTTWKAQMESRYRIWFAREDLNSYAPEAKRVMLSKIFDWYDEDFEGDHDVTQLLIRFGPEKYDAFFSGKAFRIKYKSYHWGLNDQSALGKDYKHSIFKTLF